MEKFEITQKQYDEIKKEFKFSDEKMLTIYKIKNDIPKETGNVNQHDNRLQ